MNSHEVFIHIHQGCFAGTGAIVRLPQCQWSKPDGYGKISQCITTTKHSKAKTVCIFLGIYCKSAAPPLFVQSFVKRAPRKTLNLRVTGLCAGNHRLPVDSTHKRPVTRKIFPFVYVIMNIVTLWYFISIAVGNCCNNEIPSTIMLPFIRTLLWLTLQCNTIVMFLSIGIFHIPPCILVSIIESIYKFMVISLQLHLNQIPIARWRVGLCGNC